MDGFDSEIVLVMSAKNGRHRQGIWGPEFVVPSGVERILYPVFLPEWLETTRTSRMILNGVAKVNDPQGNSRYSVSRIKSRIGFIPEGALLKISSDITELETTPLAPFEIPFATIIRTGKRRIAGPEKTAVGDLGRTSRCRSGAAFHPTANRTHRQ